MIKETSLTAIPPMGKESKKYHVTDDGDIFRVNDDGSFTSLGNAEQRGPGLEEYKQTKLVDRTPINFSQQNTTYQLVLESAGLNKLAIVKLLADNITHNDVLWAKEIVDSTPCVIAASISKGPAMALLDNIERAGGWGKIIPNSRRISNDSNNYIEPLMARGKSGCMVVIIAIIISTFTTIFF